WPGPSEDWRGGPRNLKHAPANWRRLRGAGVSPRGSPAGLCFATYGSTVFVDTAQLILKYLKDIGIEAKLDQREYGGFIASCYLGKFDSLTYGPQTPFVDPDNYVYGMHYPDAPKKQSHANDPGGPGLLARQR